MDAQGVGRVVVMTCISGVTEDRIDAALDSLTADIIDTYLLVNESHLRAELKRIMIASVDEAVDRYIASGMEGIE